MFTTARLKSAVYNNNNNNNKTAIVLSLGGGSPYTSTDKKIINIHKGNNTKNIVQTTQNTLNTSTHTAKTPIQ